jgi:hypothetical protein
VLALLKEMVDNKVVIFAAVQGNVETEWEKASKGNSWNKEVARRIYTEEIGRLKLCSLDWKPVMTLLAKQLKKLKIIDTSICPV